jgi:fumarate hydratase subunit beta
VYFGAVGGAGALLSERITAAEVIAFEDLGAEAVRRLTIEDFPVTVVIDCRGQDLYDTGRRAYWAFAGGLGQCAPIT